MFHGDLPTAASYLDGDDRPDNAPMIPKIDNARFLWPALGARSDRLRAHRSRANQCRKSAIGSASAIAGSWCTTPRHCADAPKHALSDPLQTGGRGGEAARSLRLSSLSRSAQETSGPSLSERRKE